MSKTSSKSRMTVMASSPDESGQAIWQLKNRLLTDEKKRKHILPLTFHFIHFQHEKQM